MMNANESELRETCLTFWAQIQQFCQTNGVNEQELDMTFDDFCEEVRLSI